MRVIIAGAGTMGLPISKIFARHGHDVILYEISKLSIEKAERVLTTIYLNENGINISLSMDANIFKKADFVFESISEDMEIKKLFWESVSKIVNKNILLTTNTSGLSITEMATSVFNPGRFAGMHWINPPDIIPLVEVINGKETLLETSREVMDIAISLNKKPVLVKKDIPGFLLNRLQFSLLREAMSIVESGAAEYEDIDKVVKLALGLRYACIGPFETADLGGLDVFLNIAKYLYKDLNNDVKPDKSFIEMVNRGDYGLKSGRGFYDYSSIYDKTTISQRDKMLTAVIESLEKISGIP